ncbi:MAG TPA: GNAT family N-acetyltransferase [Solirubrobacteraceae bacterium]|nr:GNAT family N-acetyltransferase [Solirubrobacteraceae bacterium]
MISHAAVTLRDGRSVTLAPLSAPDEADVVRLLDTLADPRAAFFTRAAAERGHAGARGELVARTLDGELAGYAAWIAEDGGRAGECAGVVDPRFTTLGLGTLLLRRGARDALDAGLSTLSVELHPGSRALAAMLRDCGLHTQWDLEYPVVHVNLSLGTRRPGWQTPVAAA